MNKNDDLQTLTIKELFDKNEQYVIPIYQRNYAWGATEIEQLIQDIYDSAIVSSPADKNHYFLGSLVVYLRNSGLNDSKTTYETIDGQQRHTTLSILLAFLKNQPIGKSINLDELNFNLNFDSRPKSARTLYDLYHNEPSNEPEEHTIKAAYDIISRYFKKENLDVERFCAYLLEDVQILRVAVPEDTDLNHFFEIMNNRGEQLEKHEVLKAKLMSMYGEDVDAQSCFSAIWDACSDMHRYVQLGFSSTIREDIFGEKWSNFPDNFETIKSYFADDKKLSEGRSLSDLIANRQYKTSGKDDDEKEKVERFDSIIDFSNFLLQVLKATTKENIPLDDKKLIEVFSSKEHETTIDPTTFIMNLLKCRMLFDRYIIKRDNNEKWSLLSLEPYNKSFSYINSFGQDEDISVNLHLTMILSMFHVSYPTMSYKHWFNGALKSLLKLVSTEKVDISGEQYLTELEELSNKFFQKIYCPDEEETYCALHQGTGVQNFVFNRLDYLLWKKLQSGYSFEQVDMGYIKQRSNVFQFTFRTSVEHYFPQTNPWGQDPMEDVDRFGNLCLITPSNNSKLSNYSPEDKKKYYADHSRTESLKQAFMMSYEQWGIDGKGYSNIKDHEEMMISVLMEE